jgi:hypothetical protein
MSCIINAAFPLKNPQCDMDCYCSVPIQPSGMKR